MGKQENDFFMTIEEVLAHLDSITCPQQAVEMVSLDRLVGRIAAEPVYAQFDMPDLDRSAMDGYALAPVHDGDLGPYQFVGSVLAGDGQPAALLPGQAMRITTGAPVPAGADRVVMQEYATQSGLEVSFSEAGRAGQHIRAHGSELSTGAQLVSAGERIQPLHIGLLAAQGNIQIPVYRRLRVGVLSTGNELVEPGNTLLPGQIYDCNRPQLLALLRNLGCEAIDLGRIPDDAERTRTGLQAAASIVDVILSSGGASVGEADHVRDAVQAQGEIAFWRVAIKPGKPFAYGHVAGVPFFALPGNPVAAVVTLQILARPWLLKRSGLRQADSMLIPASLEAAFRNRDARPVYLRAKWLVRSGEIVVQILEQQGSAEVSSLAAANCLLRCEPWQSLQSGDQVNCILLPDSSSNGVGSLN
ncbi:molybdopterin molybdotransferase MoeA [Burkholderiaceae bacterium DAT-1]|nr:molybdopterin molybdotransferase MoeA [Burkholderiaceae bacterium DAT-1]